MDSIQKDYTQLWAAKRKQYEAEAEKLGAEARMEMNKALDDFGAEVSAASDWTEATWNEFLAKVKAKWHEFTIDRKQDSITDAVTDQD